MKTSEPPTPTVELNEDEKEKSMKEFIGEIRGHAVDIM